MISLLLDTSNFKLVVAVVDEDKNEVLSYYNEKLNSDLSVKVFEVIKQCIDNANIIPNEIDKIYSITGPGSFTGVRIGVTICKTFAWTLNKKVIPISSLELLASTNTNYELNVAMIDARRDCVYAGVYDNKLNTVIEDRYISIEQLCKLADKFKYSIGLPLIDTLIHPDTDISMEELTEDYTVDTTGAISCILAFANMMITGD